MEMWVWLGIFVVLAIIEGMTYQLVSIWFCLGAVAGIIAAGFGATVWEQIICCAIVGAITLLAFRPYMKKKITPKLTKTNLDRLEGMSAVVIEEVSRLAGAVKADGKEWNAKTYDTAEIPAGEPCKVLKLEGNKLIVTVEPIIEREEN